MRIRIRRIALWLGAALLCLLVACAGLAYAFVHKFYPSVPPPRFPPPRSTAESQHQDLEYFRHYLELNRSYSPAAHAEAARLLDEYEAKAGRMTAAQFELAIAKMVALSDNGHSVDYADAFPRRHNKLPCMLYRFADGYYIVRARPACRALLGSKLLGMDGHSTEELADRMFAYVLGPRNHYDQSISPFYLESPELLNAAGLTTAPDHVTLHILQDGTEGEAPMSADPPDPNWNTGVYSDYGLSAEPIPGARGDWQSYLPSHAKLPLLLADYRNPFHVANWPNIYYVCFRSNTDAGDHRIRPFIAEVEKEISSRRPRVVILDLRFDQGGDFTKTASLMSHVTTLAPTIERVYVLTSAWTFSAGETSVALAKEHGDTKETIVGQPVGDRMRFWGEGGNMSLPNSAITMRFATGLHDYSKPCWGEPDCFWILHFFPMHVKTITPDVAIPYTFADYSAARDPVLDYVLQQTGTSTGP